MGARSSLAWISSLVAVAVSCGSSPTPPAQRPPPRESRAEPGAVASPHEVAATEPDVTLSTIPCAAGDAVSDIAAGDQTACAVVRGRVACWGQLGRVLATAEDTLMPPTFVGGPADVVRVATNGARIYAVDAAGALHRWSRDRPPVVLERGVADVVVGSDSTDDLCLSMVDGEGRCYRHPMWTNGGSLADGPLREPIWRSQNVVDFALSHWLLCALVRDRGVECARGPTIEGSAGTGVFVDYRTPCLLRGDAAPLCASSRARGDVARELFGARFPSFATTGSWDARWGHCFVDGEGETRCELLGQRTRSTPAPEDLVMGRHFACARCGGQVSCWGDSSGVWLGRPAGYRGPVELAGVTDGTRLRVLDMGGCVVRRSGSVRCWGDGLGLDGPLSETDERVRALLEGRPAPPRHYGCELREGRVSCLDGSGGSREVPGLRGALELIHDGGYHCARTAEAIVCWPPGGAPVRFPIRDVRGYDVGSLGDVCVIAGDASLRCAHVPGMYSTMQSQILGTNERELVPVLGLGDVRQVEIETTHGCVLHASGRVSCFGDPSDDRLGDGGTFVGEPFAIELPDPPPGDAP